MWRCRMSCCCWYTGKLHSCWGNIPNCCTQTGVLQHEDCWGHCDIVTFITTTSLLLSESFSKVFDHNTQTSIAHTHLFESFLACSIFYLSKCFWPLTLLHMPLISSLCLTTPHTSSYMLGSYQMKNETFGMSMWMTLPIGINTGTIG